MTDVVAELFDQTGNQIERRVDARIPSQSLGHVQVVLGRMKSRPRQAELAYLAIPVMRLVHVPQERHVERFSHGSRNLDVHLGGTLCPVNGLRGRRKPKTPEVPSLAGTSEV